MAITEYLKNIKAESGETVAPTAAPEAPADLLSPDPAPGRKGQKRSRPASPPPVTARARTQIADSLTMWLLPPATFWAMRDPTCGGVALEVLDNTIARLVPIVARNPTALRFFTEGSGWMEYVALFNALAPLGAVVFKHHVVGRGHGQEETDVDEAEDFSRYAAPAFA